MTTTQTISPELLEILACPKCKRALRQVADVLQCQDPACGLRFPVRDGIPILLLDEALPPVTSPP